MRFPGYGSGRGVLGVCFRLQNVTWIHSSILKKTPRSQPLTRVQGATHHPGFRVLGSGCRLECCERGRERERERGRERGRERERKQQLDRVLPPIKGYGGLPCLFDLVCATCGCNRTADNKQMHGEYPSTCQVGSPPCKTFRRFWKVL